MHFIRRRTYPSHHAFTCTSWTLSCLPMPQDQPLETGPPEVLAGTIWAGLMNSSLLNLSRTFKTRKTTCGWDAWMPECCHTCTFNTLFAILTLAQMCSEVLLEVQYPEFDVSPPFSHTAHLKRAHATSIMMTTMTPMGRALAPKPAGTPEVAAAVQQGVALAQINTA